MTTRYGKSSQKTVKTALHRLKKGTLKSGRAGKGGTVKSRKQAIAIGLSEARAKGAKVPSRSTRATTSARSSRSSTHSTRNPSRTRSRTSRSHSMAR